MTTATRPTPAFPTSHAPRTTHWLGLAGVALGVAAGLTQLVAGSTIPAWSGNKIDTVGLGITTIVLSLVSGLGLWYLGLPLPRWARRAVLLLVLACAAVCFTTVGRLWYVPGPLLVAAGLLAFSAGASEDLSRPPAAPGASADATHPMPSRVGVGGWLLYAVAVVVGLAVAVSSLVTVLLGAYASSVAVAAAVALVAGLAMSAGVAPALKRRAPAMLAGGFGAGLMAAGIVLGVSAVMIAMS
ncbi:MAG: hypothetical protein WCF04_00765 [Candidatus Nanopelagicales bacterium]